jgi:c-di-GMP-related signal transduction protein
MLATNKPSELVTLSIVRARFCERLAQLGGMVEHGDAFMMGMFSLLDALVDRPLDEALREVDLGPEITKALLGTAAEQDVLAKIFRLTQRHEVGDWDEIEELAQECRVPAPAVGTAYVEATVWAERLLGRHQS